MRVQNIKECMRIEDSVHELDVSYVYIGSGIKIYFHVALFSFQDTASTLTKLNLRQNVFAKDCSPSPFLLYVACVCISDEKRAL